MQEYILECPRPNRSCGWHTFSILSSAIKRSDNTSGGKGIYRRGEKFAVKVVILGKQIQLGLFPSLDDAISARIEFIDLISKAIVPDYTDWQTLAMANPDWAESHPFRIKITQKRGQLPHISFIPYE